MLKLPFSSNPTWTLLMLTLLGAPGLGCSNTESSPLTGAQAGGNSGGAALAGGSSGAAAGSVNAGSGGSPSNVAGAQPAASPRSRFRPTTCC